MGAEERFQNIFKEKILYANPKSFFINKVKDGQPKDCNILKSVSFAFASLEELPSHFDARGSEYGICFFHDFLQNSGLRPVVYINECDEEQKKALVFNSPHLLEVYSSKYDMRWEREWRISRNLHFNNEDIAFVIVPEDKYGFYLDWFENNEEFQELIVLSAITYKSFIDHLILHPQRSNNNWDQVRIYANDSSRGMKVDSDTFNVLSGEQRGKFAQEKFVELNCFAKNTILTTYERKFVSRYLDFVGKLSDAGLANAYGAYVQIIQSNAEEPEDSERDLVKGLFEDMYRMFAREIFDY
ncbi:MAG: hypothetical protein EOP51_05545 [Sphingobacteriales bacterium]|nr:MAG: hypothetical protein EOP51_05545 [Sphingobacteriales bacterium]